jgi:hypothetical protein
LLHRIVSVSQAVGQTGRSAQSLAQILGASERNNRRDEIGAALLFHGDEIVQVAEGARVDLDRMLRRVVADPRHAELEVIEDRPVMQRRYREPMRLCQTDHRSVTDRSGGRRLRDMTAPELERLMIDCSQRAA